MFNLYQHMNKHDEKEVKESPTTGHDRFYQERSRSGYRKKKKKPCCRRAQSSADLNPASPASSKRAIFSLRSVSTDKEESEEDSSERTPLVAQKIDSIAKLLFNKTIIGSPSCSAKNSPNAEPGTSPRTSDLSVESAAATAICMEHLSTSTRYEFITELNAIGSRRDRYWFGITDNSIKTDRLLTLMPLGGKCPIEGSERSRRLILELFRALHHPYIYPVLDVDFYAEHIITIIPFNARGSLKDLIYGSTWNEEYQKKYNESGSALPLWQVGRLGRQILEGLIFLRDKGFPPFVHLHTANVMLQNGVARISGLENCLVGAPPRFSWPPIPHVESFLFGHVLYEMCTGTPSDTTIPHLGLVELTLDKYPQVIEILETIFSHQAPDLPELLMCDFFRKIDLREMKGPSLPNFSQRLSGSCKTLLDAVVNSNIHHTIRSEGCTPVDSPVNTRRRYHTFDDYQDNWRQRHGSNSDGFEF